MTLLMLLTCVLGQEVVPLNGPWEVAKSSDPDNPPAIPSWETIEVPGRIEVDAETHLWYRRTFSLPSSDYRRAFLRLWGAKFAPKVSVNGHVAGEGYDGFTPFEIDITPFIGPGEQSLLIGCRSFAAMTDGEVDFSQGGRIRDLLDDHTIGPTGSQWSHGGLWEEVELILTGDLAIRDTFVKTSYRQRRIEVDVRVQNFSERPMEEVLHGWIEPVEDVSFIRGDSNLDRVVDISDPVNVLIFLFLSSDSLPCDDSADANDDAVVDITDPIYTLQHLFSGGPAPAAPYPIPGSDPTPDNLDCSGEAPRFPAIDVTLPAGETVTLTLSAPWNEPSLWSPESPFLYRLHLRIGNERKTVRFGFREFWCDGPSLFLNGVRRRFLVGSCHPYVFGREAARWEIELYKDLGCNAFRFHAQPWERYWYDLADEMGIFVVHESALWCGYYKWPDPRFWTNAAAHVRGNVLRDRNHPSLVIWSVENEALHCGADTHPESASQLAALAAEIRALDPTRPLMFEGDDDPEGCADIINLHYPQEPPKARLWPDVAWWLEQPTQVHAYPRTIWEWTREKPFYIGEFLWLSPRNPHTPTVFTGDATYTDVSDAHYEAKARSWTMAIQAYRGLDVSGLCPWNVIRTADGCRVVNQRCFQKAACFFREFEDRFFGGTRLSRTLYIHNDFPEPLSGMVRWQLRGGEETREDALLMQLPPARSEARLLEIPLPDVDRETTATLDLTIVRVGDEGQEEELFHDVLSWIIVPLTPLPHPEGITIYDPAGTLASAFGEEGVPAQRISALESIPPETKLLIVGEETFGSDDSLCFSPFGTGASLERFVRQGGRALLLPQSHGLPLLSLKPSTRSSTIAFIRVPDHPLLAGLTDADLRFWYPGHTVARHELYKPVGSSGLGLVDSGSSDGLSSAALVEIRAGEGSFLFCQLEILKKMRTAPAARTIWRNVLSLAPPEPEWPARIGILESDSRYLQHIQNLDLEAENISTLEDLTPLSVLLLDASRNLAADAIPSLEEFLGASGTLLLHGLTPQSIDSYRAFLGDINLSSSLSPPFLSDRSPLTRGLANYHLQWFGSAQSSNQRPDTLPDIAPWVVERPFDLTAYATLEAESLPLPASGARVTSDGLWFYANTSVTFEFEAESAGAYLFGLEGYGTPLDEVYAVGALAIDDAAVGYVTFTAESGCRTLDTVLAAGRHTARISFVNDDYAPPEDRNLFLDAILFGPDPEHDEYRSLLQPKALTVFDNAPGRIILDQVLVENATGDNEFVAEQYSSLLLRNLGGRFTADRYGLLVSPEDFTPRDIAAFGLSNGVAHINSNGEMGCSVRWESEARTTFRIFAGGTPLESVFPHVELKLDGEVIAEFDVRDQPIAPYDLGSFIVSEGDHDVAIVFTNDAYDPPADRNLRVSKLLLYLADS